MGERVEGDFKLLADDLSGLDSAYAGRVDLSGHVEGPRTGMHVQAEANANGLRGRGKTLEALAVRVDASMDPKVPFDAELHAFGFTAGKNHVDSVEVHAAGTLAAHQATLLARGLQGSMDLLLSGAWADSTWTGKLDSLEVKHPQGGLWRLSRPAAMTASRNGGAI